MRAVVGPVATVVLVAVLLAVPGGGGLTPSGRASMAGDAGVPSTTSSSPTIGGPPGAFAFVSNFEDGRLDGWHVSQGAARVSDAPAYHGEPSLRSTAGPRGPQVDRAGRGFVRGDDFLSFQADIRAGSSDLGLIGLREGPRFVAVVGVGAGDIWGGSDPASVRNLGPIPADPAQPAGWVYVMTNVYRATNAHGERWVMDVFVDRTDRAFRTHLPVPDAGNYTGAQIETPVGTVAYTNVIFTTYQIPLTAPYSVYNPMDGYGQGLGTWVTLLPAFTTLTTSMTLDNWSSPEVGVLSYQFNAMNLTGTVGTSCRGFFQLGVDLDPGGKIAPWYVWRGCNPHYFGHTGPGGAWSGFRSPPGTRLTLRLQDDLRAGALGFQIIDWSVRGADRYWNASIPYTGGEFFSTFTQLEWQPSSSYPIAAYFFNGSMADLSIAGGHVGRPTRLSGEYMLPIVLDAPPSWNLYYYNDATGGYRQLG